MGYRVAVVGATGNVGREVLNILAERKFPADEVYALASSKSIGREMWETFSSFDDYVRLYQLQRSEGVLLRYLDRLA